MSSTPAPSGSRPSLAWKWVFCLSLVLAGLALSAGVAYNFTDKLLFRYGFSGSVVVATASESSRVMDERDVYLNSPGIAVTKEEFWDRVAKNKDGNASTLSVLLLKDWSSTGRHGALRYYFISRELPLYLAYEERVLLPEVKGSFYEGLTMRDREVVAKLGLNPFWGLAFWALLLCGATLFFVGIFRFIRLPPPKWLVGSPSEGF